MKVNKRINSGDFNLKERLVSLRRVVKVTKGGRNFSFSAVVVVGNGEGVAGYGLGKANEVTEAISKGVNDAKKNLIKIPTLNESIAHEVTGEYGSGIVFMKPASPGTGIIAGGPVRIVLEVAGIQNVLSKSKGSSNSCNVVKATFDALSNLRNPLEIAKTRGISLDKLFNG